MATLDRIHGLFGRKELGMGHAGVKSPNGWTTQRAQLSSAYTTNWDQLMEVEA